MLLVSYQGECEPGCWRGSQGLMRKINRNGSPWLTDCCEDGPKKLLSLTLIRRTLRRQQVRIVMRITPTVCRSCLISSTILTWRITCSESIKTLDLQCSSRASKNIVIPLLLTLVFDVPTPVSVTICVK